MPTALPSPTSGLQLPLFAAYEPPASAEFEQQSRRLAELDKKVSGYEQIRQFGKIQVNISDRNTLPEAVHNWVAQNRSLLPKIREATSEYEHGTYSEDGRYFELFFDNGLDALIHCDGVLAAQNGALDRALASLHSAARVSEIVSFGSFGRVSLTGDPLRTVAEITCYPEATQGHIDLARKIILEAIQTRMPVEAAIEADYRNDVDFANRNPAPFPHSVFGFEIRDSRRIDWIYGTARVRVAEMRNALARPGGVADWYPKAARQMQEARVLQARWDSDTSLETEWEIRWELRSLNYARACLTLIDIAEHVHAEHELPTELKQTEVWSGEQFAWYPNGVSYDFSNHPQVVPASRGGTVPANTPFFYTSGNPAAPTLVPSAPPKPSSGVPSRALAPVYALPNCLLKQIRE